MHHPRTNAPAASVWLLLALALAASAGDAKDDPLPAFTASPPVVPARAGLHEPPSTDRTPSAWACNVMTLVDEADCVLAGRVRPAPRAGDDPRTNVGLARRVGRELCTAVARETPDVRQRDKVLARCLERLADVEPLCAGGATALLDATEHFGAEHAVCYGALLALVRDTRAVGQTWAPCCACLVDAGCSPSFRACADDVARCQAPRAAPAARCDARRCEATCRATALLSAGPPPASTEKP